MVTKQRHTIVAKNKVWLEIAENFNNKTGRTRTAQQVRKIWENTPNLEIISVSHSLSELKSFLQNINVKKKISCGPPPAPRDEGNIKILMKEELDPFHNERDLDAGLHDQGDKSIRTLQICKHIIARNIAFYAIYLNAYFQTTLI